MTVKRYPHDTSSIIMTLSCVLKKRAVVSLAKADRYSLISWNVFTNSTYYRDQNTVPASSEPPREASRHRPITTYRSIAAPSYSADQ